MKPEIELVPHRAAICSDQPTTIQLLVRIKPPLLDSLPRPEMALSIALDRSGSMSGAPLSQAKKAAQMLVDELEGKDRMALVAFDHYVDVVLDLTRQTSPKEMKTRIDCITEGGNTDLHSGWLAGCRQLTLPSVDGKSKRVIILSDGAANTGICCPQTICRQVEDWRRQGISTSAVGLGLHYNEVLLSSIAAAGGGNFSHAESAEEVEPFFAAEFQGLALTYGEQVELSLELAQGVKAVRVYNKLANRPDGSLGLTDLVLGYSKEILFEFSLPALQNGNNLCRFHLRYKDKQTGSAHRVSQVLTLAVATHAALVEFPVDAEVLAKRNIQLAARALDLAREHISLREIEKAREVMQQALLTLKESPSTPEVQRQEAQIREMISLLDQQQYQSVAKRATATSSSLSYSSITLAGTPLTVWCKLPPEERTKERLEEMLRDWNPAG